MTMDSISKTSLLTAAMRAVESKRSEVEGRLFFDPYAEMLAGAEGADLLQKAITESGDQPAIAIRTAYMDGRFSAALQDGVRQIVILAAGMDTRAYRMSLPVGTRLFELDRKEVLEYKEEKLGGIQPRCERKALVVDLREEWKDKLLEAGFRIKERTLWLVEGLLMYLEELHVEILLSRISNMASLNDIMLFDVLSRTLLEAPHMKKQLEFLAMIGAPWKFGVNDPDEFMKRFGWSTVLTQAGDVAPTRWPFPTTPIHIPNVPRGFFAEARKV